MMFSGILIQTPGEGAVAQLRPLLASDARCTPGDSSGGTLAAVLEFADGREAEDLHKWLENLPGVQSVDVVGVQYDQEPETPASKGDS